MSTYWKRIKYPVIVKVNGKDVDLYYIATGQGDLISIFYDIFRRHDEYGFYYELSATQKIQYEKIKSADHIYDLGLPALGNFIMSRNDCEYEKIDIIQPTEPEY